MGRTRPPWWEPLTWHVQAKVTGACYECGAKKGHRLACSKRKPQPHMEGKTLIVSAQDFSPEELMGFLRGNPLLMNEAIATTRMSHDPDGGTRSIDGTHIDPDAVVESEEADPR